MAGARPVTDVGAPGAVGWMLGMATAGCGDAGEPGAGVASTVAGAADDEDEEEEEEDAAPEASARLTTLSPHLAVEADGS
jgi:hypothetical protein